MEIQLSKPGYQTETNLKDHFHFVGKKITEAEIDSFLPFFQCDEIGHEELMLDQVCLDNNCLRKGITCSRCVHLRHSNHAIKVVSLRKFIGDLLQSQTSKKHVLEEEQVKCTKLRDLCIGMAREFIDGLIELFSIFVASVHKYHTIFENEFEDCMIRSDVIIHKLMHKQHVRRDHFTKYIQTTVGALGESTGKDVLLRDYEKAFKISNEFQNDMSDVAKRVKAILESEQLKLNENIDLKKLSTKVPEFDVATLAVQQKFKRDFRSKITDLFDEKNIPGASQFGKSSYNYYNQQDLTSMPVKKQFEAGDVYQIKFGQGKQSFLEQLEMLKPTLLETSIKKQKLNFDSDIGREEMRGNSSLSKIGEKDAVDLYLQEKQKLGRAHVSFQDLRNSANKPNKAIASANSAKQEMTSAFVQAIYGQSLPLQEQLKQKEQQQSKQIYSNQYSFNNNSILPRLSDYIDGGQYYACSVDSSRHKCVLGRLFKSVSNSQIYRLASLKSGLKDISCICVISEDVVAVAGRFCQFVEIYRIQDRQMISKIDTSSDQGVKSLLLIRREQDDVAEYQPILIVGTYSDSSNLLSYKLDLLRRFVDQQEPLTISVKTFKTFEKHTNEAVTNMAQLYLNEFFIVGYSSGSLAIFSTESSIPINVLPKLYESAVTNIFTVQEGKFFVTASEQKIRFHIIKLLSHSRVEQEVTSFYIGTQHINSILMTTGFNQEESFLKFQHLICGDLRFEEKENTKEGCLRILRTAQNNIRLTEEAILPVFTEQNNNSVKDMILIEPRKKSRVVWLVAFGGDHRIKLFELKGGYTETLKLWEKETNDFLVNKGTQVVKTRLLCESIEVTSLKWPDVQGKVQVLSAYENNNSGKVMIRFISVNHASKSDADIFELEMQVSYQ